MGMWRRCGIYLYPLLTAYCDDDHREVEEYKYPIAPNDSPNFTNQRTMSSDLPLTRSAWNARLATLPGSPSQIPAFYFGHGSPMLTISTSDAAAAQNPGMRALIERVGLESPTANFLRDFGPALLAKYQPKGILVFSAHWETEGEQIGRVPFLVLLTPLAQFG